MTIKNYLFSREPWSMVAARQRGLLEDEVSLLDEDQLLNTSPHDLSSYLAEKYSFRVPKLQRENIVVEMREGQIEVGGQRGRYANESGRSLLVTGTVVEVAVPFDGDAICFNTQPTTFSFALPRGDVDEDNFLIFHIEGVDLLPEQVRAQIQQTLNDINQNLNYLWKDTERFNGNLFTYAHTLIAQRRRKVLTDRKLVSGLGFKLRLRDDDAGPPLAPEDRRSVTPLLPTASQIPFRPEPVLAAKDYTLVLEVLQRAVKQLQLSPTLLAQIHAARLSDYFLVQLNANFAGKKRTEIFTSAGETDIAIGVGGKNIFVAECLVWAGPVNLVERLDQLLAYRSWRAIKVVMILLYRGEAFVPVLELIHATIKSHPNFKRELLQLSEATLPYLFAHHGDRNRELLLTLLAFHAPRVPPHALSRGELSRGELSRGELSRDVVGGELDGGNGGVDSGMDDTV